MQWFKSIVSRENARALTCAALALSALPALAQFPGSWDTSFGPSLNGRFGNLEIAAASGFDRARAVALQPDGKIVLAGECFNGFYSKMCLARLKPDGTPDDTFDGPGSTPGNGKFILSIGPTNESAYAVAVQADGKIVVSGSCTATGGNNDFCIARLLPNGDYDASFVGPNGNANGRFLLDVGGDNRTDDGYALALQPDGKIIMAGACFRLTPSLRLNDFCLVRLNADGSRDVGFNSTSGDGTLFLSFNIGRNEFGKALALQPDGKIVVAGDCFDGTYSKMCVARLRPDGSLDSSFLGPGFLAGGSFMLSVGPTNESAYAVAVQPDGKILLSGSCTTTGGTNDFCIARLTFRGEYDTTFEGPSGNAGGRFLLQVTANTDDGYALALQPDGKILLAGACEDRFCVARLNDDGSADKSFSGPGGTATNGSFLLWVAAFPEVAAARAIAVQPDGKIVLAGYCNAGTNENFCVGRLLGGLYGARTCTFDFDGDGVVSANVDSVIGARVALGMRGPAVIGGLSFSSNAKRNTWPQIRDYLFLQCGMNVY
jgi:uncharacterized delta-60 repeat protein